MEYASDEFDCIILDEAHHSAADTYQKIMGYFKPKLWLGMTATPDKRDDGEIGKIYTKFFIIKLHMRFDFNRLWRRICYVHFTILELVIFR